LDGTARPQIVRPEVHPLLHEILTEYKQRTGISALINTSFNVHEEPIVCSPADAIRGFLETGLDDLFLEGGYMVSLADNIAPAYEFLRKGLAQPTLKEVQLASINDRLHRVAEDRLSSLQATHAEAEVQRTEAQVQRKAAEERLASATEKETEIAFLSGEVKKRDVILADLQNQLQRVSDEIRFRDERIAEVKRLAGERLSMLENLHAQTERERHEFMAALESRDERMAELERLLEKVHTEAERGRNEWAAALRGRDERVLEIEKDTDERIAEVKRLAGERLSMLENLHAQTERERHEFMAALESRDERIAELERLLEKVHTEAERSPNEWAAALRGRDERIERILTMQKETENRVAEMKRLADERLMMLQGLHLHAERERQELRAALKSRDERIGELERVLEERLRLVEALHSEAERTRHEVSIAINAREERIAELEHAVAKLRQAAEFTGKASS
jgi:DNA repair exonuclease SbcCD ATPase subunit